MVARIVAAALRAPLLVALAAIGLVGSGLWAYKKLDIEAYPNPVPPMIELITQPEGMSAEEVERYVTVPLETGLQGMPGLEHVRSQSLFGLSDVKAYFTWDVSYKEARQEVLNRLQFIKLPEGVQAELSPWNAIGEVYRYVLRGKGYSLADLKTAQDWILERQFRRVPGVIDVVSFGGHTKQYQVEVDPNRLKAHQVTLSQLVSAIAHANQNVGGQRLTIGEQSFNVRGIGLIRSLKDIGEIVVAEVKGTPVRVRDLAHALVGAAPRLGIVGKDAEPEVVQGAVIMRYGGDSLKTLGGIHAQVETIRKYHLLPPGMEIETYYDRERLIHLTTHTVIENLIVGMLLVTLTLWLFLGHARAALVTAMNIPLALFIAFLGMVVTGTPANLISLGAVDFGIVVDSTVIMMENLFRHLSDHGHGSVRERTERAAEEVGPSILFATLVVAVAFLPLFTLTGVAGVIFTPVAYTYAFAVGGALLCAVTLTPVLAGRALRRDVGRPEPENRIMQGLERLYVPLFAFALRRRRLAVAVGLLPVALAAVALPFLGREFMPKLEEGNFWIRATLPTSISLEASARYVGRLRAIVRGCPEEGACPRPEVPEVEAVVSQLGRPDDGTDVSGYNNIELFAPLKPTSEWRRGMTKERLTDELAAKMRAAFPGVSSSSPR